MTVDLRGKATPLNTTCLSGNHKGFWDPQFHRTSNTDLLQINLLHNNSVCSVQLHHRVADRDRLQWTVRSAERTVSVSLPSIQDCVSPEYNISADPTPQGHRLFQLLV